MESLLKTLKWIDGWVWGLPLIILLVGTGLYLTILLRGIQFRKLGYSLYLGLIRRKDPGSSPGEITHFQALMTALSATVGTGNIAGVATALAAGGPGALFWMWVTGLVGMATKYAEAVLAVRFREKDKNGQFIGGPMYYIAKGLKLPWLGGMFALFATIASFGIGNMVQSNSVADALHEAFQVPFWLTGGVLVVLTALVILGGIKSIGKVTGVVVPVMIGVYVLLTLTILVLNFDEIPDAFALIFTHAFSPTSAVGGFAGAAVKEAITKGVSRGVFSNESGLGSSPIAAAAAQTNSPVSQALVSMTQTFIDTLFVCTLTGLALITTGVWSSGETGAALTANAFTEGLGGKYGGQLLAVSLSFFAYSTILGWSYYGEKAVEFLLGERSVLPYRILFIAVVGVGAMAKLDLVWVLSDIFNGLMALPNLIGLLFLAPLVREETLHYFQKK